jgi:hypothetical protein
MKLLIMLAVSSTMLLLTSCETSYYSSAPAARNHQPPAPPPPPAHSRTSEPSVNVSITVHERQVIQGYVAGQVVEEKHPKKGKKPKKLPPGLQKKLDRGGSLPPGWEKKLRKGEVVPPEIYEQCHPLPHEVMVELPPQPSGTILIAVGGKVARILAATREILDIFDVEY